MAAVWSSEARQLGSGSFICRSKQTRSLVRRLICTVVQRKPPSRSRAATLSQSIQ